MSENICRHSTNGTINRRRTLGEGSSTYHCNKYFIICSIFILSEYIHELKVHIQNSVDTDQIATCDSANSESTLLCFAISAKSCIGIHHWNHHSCFNLRSCILNAWAHRGERTNLYFLFPFFNNDFLSIFQTIIIITIIIDPNQTARFHGSTLYDCLDQTNLRPLSDMTSH